MRVDLVVANHADESLGRDDVRALSGENGRPVEGATVELLLGEWSPDEQIETIAGVCRASVTAPARG